MANIVWTINAKNDLKKIYKYIAADSKYYANTFIEKIRNTTKRIKTHPKIGGIVPEFTRDDIRELLFRNYRIIYRISGDNIFIVSIFHGARDLYKALKDLDM